MQHNLLNNDKTILLWNTFCIFMILLMLIIQKKYTLNSLLSWRKIMEFKYFEFDGNSLRSALLQDGYNFRGKLSHFLFLDIWRLKSLCLEGTHFSHFQISVVRDTCPLILLNHFTLKTFLFLLTKEQSSHYEEGDRARAPCRAPHLPCGA